MAADIIARGMAATAVRPGEDGKIPASYLPSYVDDVVDLIAIDETAPAVCAEGDKYYNSVDKLIYTATGTNTWGSTGETPAQGKIYINMAQQPATSYRWDGNNLVLIGGAGQIIQYNEMPTPESNILGKIIQYTGENDGNYVKGYYYICVSDGHDPATYSWSNIGVQGCENFMSIDADGCWNITNFKPGVYFYPKAEVSGQTTPEGFPAFSIQVEEVKLANLISAENGVRIFKSPLEAETGDIVLETYYHEGPCIKRLTLAKTANSWAETYNNILVYMDSGSDQSIAGTKTFNALPQSSAVPYLDNHLVNKKFVDNNFLGTKAMMPAASANYLNKIVEYVGDTNANYTHGYFYECISDGEDPVTYSWKNINVQENKTIQYDIMPEPTEEPLGKVVQYIGDANENYVHSWFYECIEREPVATLTVIDGMQGYAAIINQEKAATYFYSKNNFKSGTKDVIYHDGHWYIDEVIIDNLQDIGLQYASPAEGNTLRIDVVCSKQWEPVIGLSDFDSSVYTNGYSSKKGFHLENADVQRLIAEGIDILLKQQPISNHYYYKTGIFLNNIANSFNYDRIELVSLYRGSLTNGYYTINLDFEETRWGAHTEQNYGIIYLRNEELINFTVYIKEEDWDSGLIKTVCDKARESVGSEGGINSSGNGYVFRDYNGGPLGTRNNREYHPTESYNPSTKSYADSLYTNTESEITTELYLVDDTGVFSNNNTLEEGDSYTVTLGNENELVYVFNEDFTLNTNSTFIINGMFASSDSSWANINLAIKRNNEDIVSFSNLSVTYSTTYQDITINPPKSYPMVICNLKEIKAGDTLVITKAGSGADLLCQTTYEKPTKITIVSRNVSATSVVDTIDGIVKTQHEWNETFAEGTVEIPEEVFRLTQSSSVADILAAFGGETDLNTLIDKLNNGARAYVSYDATVQNPRVYTVDCSSNSRDERVDGSGTVILAFEYNTGERIVGGAYTFAYTSGSVTNAIATVTATDCVTLDANQTISGKKTFTTLPESSVVPTSDDQLVNKKYVDNNAGGGAFVVKLPELTGSYGMSKTYSTTEERQMITDLINEYVQKGAVGILAHHGDAYNVMYPNVKIDPTASGIVNYAFWGCSVPVNASNSAKVRSQLTVSGTWVDGEFILGSSNPYYSEKTDSAVYSYEPTTIGENWTFLVNPSLSYNTRPKINRHLVDKEYTDTSIRESYEKIVDDIEDIKILYIVDNTRTLSDTNTLVSGDSFEVSIDSSNPYLEYTFTAPFSITDTTDFVFTGKMRASIAGVATRLKFELYRGALLLCSGQSTLATNIGAYSNSYTFNIDDYTFANENIANIQSGDVLRIYAVKSATGSVDNVTYYFASTYDVPAKFEIDVRGIYANKIVDTINGTTKTQHDWNVQFAQGGGGGGGFDVTQLGFDAFSDQSTYAVGDFVTYNNKIYKCTTAVTTAGAWNAANWTESSMKGYVDSIVGDINSVLALLTTPSN